VHLTGSKSRAAGLSTLMLYCYLAKPAECIRSVSCVVEPLGAILPPRIESIACTCVSLSYRPPAGANPHKVIAYIIKYRKVGSRYWKFTKKTRRLRQTVSGLVADTQYEFRVVAWYRRGSSRVESKSMTVFSKRGTYTVGHKKCATFIFRITLANVDRFQ